MEKYRILVTAGNTRIPIDRVRGINNIFKGRTGVVIADYFVEKGCDVTLLTSHPKLASPRNNLRVMKFSSYDSLFSLMEREVRSGVYDVVIHSAAVSDYCVSGTYTSKAGNLVEVNSAGKIGSDHLELWLKLTPTIKIVDQVRAPWGFGGVLVKFKLQVGVSDQELVAIATKSMQHSRADFIVANTLEEVNQKAFVISRGNKKCIPVIRSNLPETLFTEIFS